MKTLAVRGEGNGRRFVNRDNGENVSVAKRLSEIVSRLIEPSTSHQVVRLFKIPAYVSGRPHAGNQLFIERVEFRGRNHLSYQIVDEHGNVVAGGFPDRYDAKLAIVDLEAQAFPEAQEKGKRYRNRSDKDKDKDDVEETDDVEEGAESESDLELVEA